MRDKRRDAFLSGTRERIVIAVVVIVFVGALALLALNLLETPEPSLPSSNDVKPVGTIALKPVDNDQSQLRLADDNALRACENNPDAKELSFVGTPLTNRGLRYLSVMKHLQRLDLTSTGISDDGLTNLEQLQLVSLTLAFTRIGDPGLVSIAKIKSLTELDLSSTGITSGGLATLASLPKLVHLRLGQIIIDAKGVDNITKLKALKTLELPSTALTDAELLTITRMKHLLSIDLSNSDITDSGLKNLERMPELIHVSVNDCPNLTDEAITRLRQSMPKLEIVKQASGQSMTAMQLLERALGDKR